MATVTYKIDGNLLPTDINTSKGNYQILAKTVELCEIKITENIK